MTNGEDIECPHHRRAVRGYPLAKDIGLPSFSKSTTPRNASYFNMYRQNYNIPTGYGGILIMPSDRIANDDYAMVVVPPKVTTDVI